MKNTFVFALLAFAITTPAFAEENSTASTPAPVETTPPASVRTFIGGDIGMLSGYPDSTGTIVSGQLAGGWTSASATQKIATTSYGIHGGQWLSERLGWEVGYGAFGNVKGSFSSSSATQSYYGSYEYSASSVYAAVLGAIPLGAGKLYGKAGLHSTSTTTNYTSYLYTFSRLQRTYSGSTTTSSTGFLLGGGYEYAFNKNWAVRADVTMFNGAQFASVTNFATIADQTLFQTAAGLNYSF